jgi:hypothetical protein
MLARERAKPVVEIGNDLRIHRATGVRHRAKLVFRTPDAIPTEFSDLFGEEEEGAGESS